jgi:hypothetical protein
VAATETIRSLDLADALRDGRVDAKPFDLWLAAKHESGGRRAGRLERYRHALIHAGYLTTSRGRRYKRCPQCHMWL